MQGVIHVHVHVYITHDQRLHYCLGQDERCIRTRVPIYVQHFHVTVQARDYQYSTVQ